MIHFTNVLMVALLTASATCALPTPVRVEKAIARTPFAVSPENPISSRGKVLSGKMDQDSVNTKRANAVARTTSNMPSVDISFDTSGGGDNWDPSHYDTKRPGDGGPNGPNPYDTPWPGDGDLNGPNRYDTWPSSYDTPPGNGDPQNPELFANPGTDPSSTSTGDSLFSNGADPSSGSNSTTFTQFPSFDSNSTTTSNGTDPSSVDNTTSLPFEFNSTSTATAPPSPVETSSQPGRVYRRLREARVEQGRDRPGPPDRRPDRPDRPGRRPGRPGPPDRRPDRRPGRPGSRVEGGLNRRQKNVNSRRAIAKAKLARDQS